MTTILEADKIVRAANLIKFEAITASDGEGVELRITDLGKEIVGKGFGLYL